MKLYNPISVFLVFLISIKAFAICKDGVKAPAGTPVAGSAIATEKAAGVIIIGPGGPVYVHVKNISTVGASFIVLIKKKGAAATSAFCQKATVLAEDGEYWIESKYAGDGQAAREVVVATGVVGAKLEVTVYKLANVLPTTISDTITVRMRAFIPNVNAPGSDFVRPLPGQPNKWMVPGPAPDFVKLLPIESVKAAADCFYTDNRGFSSDRAAEAKLTTEFRIIIYYGQVYIEPSDVRQVHKAAVSVRCDCKTGAVIAQKPADFNALFGVRALGKPATAGYKVQIIGQAAVGNPHVLGAPMIDYSFDITYDASTKSMNYAVNIGHFPAFEFYAFRGKREPVTILQLLQEHGSAWGLADGGVGFRTKRLTGTKVL